MNRALLALLLLLASPLFAASEFPPSYRWRTIEGEHFLVHYHQGEEELARRAADIAERVHERVVPLMGWEPRERTHLILTDHIDAANGSATFFPENRIEIFVSAPGGDPSSPIEYYDNWLGLVITHEYTHILHLDQARGFSGFLRKALGRNPLSFPNELSPLWMIEGIATLVESEETEAGRLKGTYVDMVLRTAAVEGRWASEPQAGGLTGAWPEGSARYFYGSKFLSWLARTKGPDKLRDYFADYSGNVIPFGVNASAEDVYGTDMRSLWEEWSAQQQAEYREEQRRLAAEGLTARERLTSAGYYTTHPIVSPDGSRVAYAHEGPYGWPSIRVWDVNAKRDIASHRVNSLSHLSWSPDGTTLAFSQLDFHGSFSLLSDLYLWSVAHGVRRLTHGARLKDPAFTPDGRTLIAVENRAGRNRLVEVDASTGAMRVLVEPNDYTQFSEPSVSGDGKQIAVAEWHNGSIDVVLYDRGGRRIANLTESMPRSTNASPRFVPGGNELLFTSDVTGVPNVYRAPLAGGAPQRLTNLYGGAFFPSTADGRRVFYSDYSSNGFDLASFEVGAPRPATPRVIPATVMGRSAERRAMATPSPGEPAATSAGQDVPYSPWRSLIPKWWFPVVTGDENTTRVGATTSAADVLGFHSYSATVAAGEHDADYALIYAYDRLYPTFTLLASELTDEPEGIGIRRGTEIVQYRERTQRFFGSMTIPYRRVRWQTLGSAGFIRDRVRPEVGGDDPARSGIFTGVLQGIRASAAFNSAAEFGYSISPENGVTALLDFENLSRALGSDATRRTARGDLRGYLAIPYALTPVGRHVLAARAAAGRASGDFVLQRELRVGGVGVGEFLGLDITDFPVRGYETGVLRGESAALVSLEYRFPLWQIERGPATYPIFFHRLVGDVFYDTGTAWNHKTPGERAFREGNTISSAGAEVGLDLVLGFWASLRYRVGAAYRFDQPDKGSVGVYVTIGSSF